MSALPKTYRRKKLRTRSHVTIEGNLHVSEIVYVGGDLTVQGDLICDGPVLCMGRLVVRGNLRGTELRAGFGIDVHGNLSANACFVHWWPLDGGLDTAHGESSAVDALSGAFASSIADYYGNWKPIKADRLLTPEVRRDIEAELELCDHGSLAVGGDCTVGIDPQPLRCWFVVGGEVNVKGRFNPDDVQILGPLTARSAAIEGDADCLGGIFVAERLYVEGDLNAPTVECGELECEGSVTVDDDLSVKGVGDRQCDPMQPAIFCWGELEAGQVVAAGAVEVLGPIRCHGYLRAEGSIAAAGPITTGARFGILAGLGVPRDTWLESGYVCAPERPARILTGQYRELARRSRRDVHLKPRRVRIPG
jgi:cytoskeletal protein CcmA (bactofilin family)